MKMPQLVLIDLDGTLVDSVPDLTLGVDGMMAQLGLVPPGEEQVRRWVGNGIERLVKRALTGDLVSEPEVLLFKKALPIFMTQYAGNNGNVRNETRW